MLAVRLSGEGEEGEEEGKGKKKGKEKGEGKRVVLTFSYQSPLCYLRYIVI